MTAPTLDYMPTWKGVGSCAGQPDLMYPGPGDSTGNQARAICNGCPVLAECRTWVLALPFAADPGGVVAALTYDDRESLAYAHRPTKVCARCGQVKARREFALWTNAKPGRRPDCRTCWATKARRGR